MCGIIFIMTEKRGEGYHRVHAIVKHADRTAANPLQELNLRFQRRDLISDIKSERNNSLKIIKQRELDIITKTLRMVQQALTGAKS